MPQRSESILIAGIKASGRILWINTRYASQTFHKLAPGSCPFFIQSLAKNPDRITRAIQKTISTRSSQVVKYTFVHNGITEPEIARFFPINNKKNPDLLIVVIWKDLSKQPIIKNSTNRRIS
jgi:hypothetical protein